MWDGNLARQRIQRILIRSHFEGLQKNFISQLGIFLSHSLKFFSKQKSRRCDATALRPNKQLNLDTHAKYGKAT
jgi:hypothetical protein